MAVERAQPTFMTSMVSGALAGACVDVSLFPLDTLKTRLQAPVGFRRAGGFKGIYRGLGSAFAGSMPAAALFFTVYDGLKRRLTKEGRSDAAVHMVSASTGEVAACLVRVPTEVVKQRLQTGAHATISDAVREAVRTEGIAGLYRGFTSTITRELPFACIQFPLWELFKQRWAEHRGAALAPYQAALCGSAAGGIAAAITCPLDVAKTRIMLADAAAGATRSVPAVLTEIAAKEGFTALFHGVQPRVMWISIGGFLFFGSYSAVMRILSRSPGAGAE